MLGLVIDANGTIVSSGTSSTESGPQQIEASLYVPKPGTYQVRFAVRDRRTTAVGSDTTLVTVPDKVHATARRRGRRGDAIGRPSCHVAGSPVGLIAGVLSAALVRASSQAPAAVSQPQPVFRVGVDAVRIDAVVTDKDGRVVTDLTAKDFELRQDGKVQNITLARFVPVQTSAEQPARPPQPAKKGEPAPPPPPPVAKLSKEQVQRSIALVVDDLSLSAESFEYAQAGPPQVHRHATAANRSRRARAHVGAGWNDAAVHDGPPAPARAGRRDALDRRCRETASSRSRPSRARFWASAWLLRLAGKDRPRPGSIRRTSASSTTSAGTCQRPEPLAR